MRSAACTLALMVFVVQTTTAGETLYKRPTPTQLAEWGLERIPPYSTPIRLGGTGPDKRGYLVLGPRAGSERMCVSVVRITHAAKACNTFKCQGLFSWGDKNPPFDLQHALLSQPCTPHSDKGSYLLYNNSELTEPLDFRFDSHVHALSAAAYESSLASKESQVGPWEQLRDKKHHSIVFSTQASEGLLTWHPLRGFNWTETEP